jgi:hypothetical protein
VIFRQVVHDDLGCASYLIGDEHAGVAAVVDPRLDIDEYLRAARYLGVRIEHILETHNYADLQFDDAHIPRAICITARRAGFGSKLAWLADPEQPLILVGRADEDAREAAELAGAVGLRNIGGFLAGG